MKTDLKTSQQQLTGTIVAAFGSQGCWHATFYTGSAIPQSVQLGMPVTGDNIPAGTIITALAPSSPAPVPMSIVLTNPSNATTNPFKKSENSIVLQIGNSPSSTISPVSVSNKAFVLGFDRFVIRGVAVDAAGVPCLGYKDVLADEHFEIFWTVLLPAIIGLNVNCIRVYDVSAHHSHALAMNALASAGIYVMVSLATSNDSVKQMTGAYSYETYLHATQVVSEFQAYNNTLCFAVGNEVEFPGQQAANLASDNPTWSASQVVEATIALELNVALAMKTFAQQIKAFMQANNYRAIPVGCAMQDGPQTSWTNQNPNADQRGLIGTDTIATYYADNGMDFIGINTYAYVPGGPMNSYDRLGNECLTLCVPAFLSESGAVMPDVVRDWKIVPEMYTDSNVSSQLSGQVAFQLLEEGSGFGLYSAQGSGSNISLSATQYGGATNLQSEFAAAAKLPLPAVAPQPTSTTPITEVGYAPPDPIQWWQRTASITVENYATASDSITGLIQVLQMGVMMGAVAPAANSQTPTSQNILVVPGVALSIQAQPSTGSDWFEVCTVPGASVTAGITVQNNVNWGGSCNIS